MVKKTFWCLDIEMTEAQKKKKKEEVISSLALFFSPDHF